MHESYGDGVATHTDPESCVVVREGEGEALTGGRAGRVWSREGLPRDAAPWRVAKGNIWCFRQRKGHQSPRGRGPRACPV